MSVRATKNMWVERCSNLGAKVGALLYWVSTPIRKVPSEVILPIIFLLLFFGALGSFIHFMTNDFRAASLSKIQNVLKTGTECEKTKISDELKKGVLYNRDISYIKRQCEQQSVHQKQLQLLGN